MLIQWSISCFFSIPILLFIDLTLLVPTIIYGCHRLQVIKGSKAGIPTLLLLMINFKGGPQHSIGMYGS